MAPPGLKARTITKPKHDHNKTLSARCRLETSHFDIDRKPTLDAPYRVGASFLSMKERHSPLYVDKGPLNSLAREERHSLLCSEGASLLSIGIGEGVKRETPQLHFAENLPTATPETRTRDTEEPVATRTRRRTVTPRISTSASPPGSHVQIDGATVMLKTM